jgi:hypothetical protein
MEYNAMARKLTGVTTPDGVTHDPAYIMSRLAINHGSEIVPSGPGKMIRKFTFSAGVQAFHSLEAMQAGAKPLTDLQKNANGEGMEYFQFAAKSLASLFPDGTDLKTLTVADIVDAMAWFAVAAKNPGQFDSAETVTLGKSVFTDPTVSRIVPWTV